MEIMISLRKIRLESFRRALIIEIDVELWKFLYSFMDISFYFLSVDDCNKGSQKAVINLSNVLGSL